jgi:hypothetical protein
VAYASAARCIAVSDDAVVGVNMATGALTTTSTLSRSASWIVALGSVACPNSSTRYAVGFQGTELSSKAVIVKLSSTGAVVAKIFASGSGIAAIACSSTTVCPIALANRGSVSGCSFSTTVPRALGNGSPLGWACKPWLVTKPRCATP